MRDQKARVVLLVEDNEDDAQRIQRILRNGPRRYDVTWVTSGEQALSLIHDEERRFDCVLLDYNLPDLDGLEFLRSVRGMPLAVTVLTGRDDDELAAQMLEAGAEDYLLKDGLTAHALTRSIENVIEKSEIRRQMEAQRAAAELRSHRLELTRDELRLKVNELAAATQARDRFMAMMSHEMRTPLNAILGYTELLELEIDGQLSPGQRGQLERIRVGSRHLLDLINDVLDLARADADKLELDVRAVDLSAVFDEVHALLELQARQQKLSFTIDPLPQEVPPVMADLQRLRQIVMNLASNAIKFTENGSVRLSAAYDSDANAVQVIVTDTGIGMDEDVTVRAFDEFYQADGALTRRRGGSGLGLAISRRLARAMDGDIAVTSHKGKGSTFTVTLPMAQPDTALRAEDVARHGARMALHASSTAEKRPQRSPVAVAAFGDDAHSLATLAKHVEPSVKLVWTTAERELAELVSRERVSLVILDIGARDGAAWRVAHTLSELPADRAPAVLLLPTLVPTGDGTTAPGVDLGWVSLVPKPFTAAQLTRAVATAAGQEDETAEAERPRLDVVVIDDDEDSRRVATKFLADRGMRVHQCQDGETGLAEMRMRPPDVVVLDLMMPVLDGFGVLAAMRADALLSGIPVVVLTAKTLTEAERQFLSRTAVRVLQKGEHRLADIAALVLRAAIRARSTTPPPAAVP
ncbi:MAG TPA: response regulator [Gemmatimonadaceae bacterium]|jgi:signal transduction histidine kinase